MNETSSISSNCAESASPCVAESRPVHYHRPRHHSRYDHEAWEVSVRLPGVRKEDLQVTVENEILEVKAVRRSDAPESWRPLGRHEGDRHYLLRLDVGPEVDEGRISGSLEDGVLVLRLPLREEVKPRSIEIR